MIFQFFIFLFYFIFLYLGFKIVTYENSVYGIIYLIILFVVSFLLLINWHIEFIGLVLLIVYVGAIMVFFLFILMLLNLRGLNLKVNFIKNFSIVFFNFIIIFIYIYIYIFYDFYIYLNLLNLNIYIDLYRNLDFNSQLELFGFIIFVYLFVVLFILGFILLGAMLGPIILTLRKVEDVKEQKVYIQSLRNKLNTIKIVKYV